jgi:hypothetical protein
MAEQITDDGTHAQGYAERFVWIFTDDLVHGFRAGNRFFLNIIPSLPAFFDGGREPFAGFHNLFFRHVRRGGKQRLRIFHEMFSSFLSSMCSMSCLMCFHDVLFWFLFVRFVSLDQPHQNQHNGDDQQDMDKPSMV